MMNYPKYITFSTVNREPTCVAQEFSTVLGLENENEKGKLFYPKHPQLEKYFSSEEQSLRFGAAQFCGFLQDTVHVEHYVVIPAIRDISLLPVVIPEQAHLDLFKLATDEGHHAAQALAFINAIKERFNIATYEEGKQIPLFVRELEKQKMQYADSIDRVLFNMLIGVVTETRISKELGAFIKNEDILSSVRDNCKSHQDDETIHCSQFMALGKYTWKMFNEEQKELAASIYAKTTIARSIPDISRIAFYLSLVTGLDKKQCDQIVDSIYTQEFLIEEMLIAARSTINFLGNLGVLDYKVARDIFENAGVSLTPKTLDTAA